MAKGELPPMQFEKDDVIGCPHVKYPNIFARAFGASNKNPYVYSKMLQKRKKFSFAASAHRKTVNLFRCCGFCPALENFLRAPMPMGVSRERVRGRIPTPMEFETGDVKHSSPVKP